MRRVLLLAVAAAGGAVTLWWTYAAVGPHGPWFPFLLVWVPMACFALVGRTVSTRLPSRVFAQRRWERGGRVYELVGVRLAKRLLRRGPLHVFAPSMRFPRDLTPDGVARLEARMREAETSHGVMFVLTLGVTGCAAARGWWEGAAWTLLFNVLVNGYPTLLQRYNRLLLARRFAS